MGLSIRAYAQHRGVSHVAVLKAIKTGRIAREADGSIDPHKADAAWTRNTLPSQTLSKKSAIKDRPPAALAATDTQTKVPSYQDSRAIREAYAARLAKLDFEERTAKLVSADQARVDSFGQARRLRDRLQNIPRRLAAGLAAEQDARAIEQRLADEIRQALEELSR